MIYNVVMPPLGATGGDVTIESWLVEVGQFVEKGAALLVVMTDKATVEIEAFRAGYVREILLRAGESAEIGTIIAYLADTMDEPRTAQAAPEPAKSLPALPSTAPKPMASNERFMASPLARRIAKTEGLDLKSVAGSGRDARILKRDVLKALQVRQSTLSPMRRAIAARTQHSKSTIPHFYATMTADMSDAKAFLAQAAALAEQNSWQPPTLNDLIVRAVALSLRQHPHLNAYWLNDDMRLVEDINIGIVMAVEDGMMIPVIPQADRKNLYTLAGLSRRLKARTQAGELSRADLSEVTFTISNLGMFGLDSFTAIINPPEAAILAVGAVREEARVYDDQILIRSVMTSTLSLDHRVADGIIAARFMKTLKDFLENPILLALEAPHEY